MSKLSKGVRAKVGACAVTNSGVILSGYNGLPKSLGNELEITLDDGSLQTKPEVIHAELNVILKAAREGVSLIGSTMYQTISPCRHCSSMMIGAGITRVVYQEEYRDNSFKEILALANVECIRYNTQTRNFTKE